MTPVRYFELEMSRATPLTKEELAQGWHFCYDWDGMLLGPGMPELEGCTCNTRRDS